MAVCTEGPDVPEDRKAARTGATTIRTRPGPLDLHGTTTATPPSALGAARMIEDLGLISYPEGIVGPKPELNVNSTKGKFV